MPAKAKPAVPRPKTTETTPRSATPDERGDTEVGEGGASYPRDARPRQPVQGQNRKAALPKKRPQAPRTRGVEDYEDAIAAENEKAIRKASVRARRLGLH